MHASESGRTWPTRTSTGRLRLLWSSPALETRCDDFAVDAALRITGVRDIAFGWDEDDVATQLGQLQHLFILVPTITLGDYAAQFLLAIPVHDFRKLKNVAATALRWLCMKDTTRTCWPSFAIWSRHSSGRSPGLSRVPRRNLLREPGYTRVRSGCRVRRTGRRTHSVAQPGRRRDWINVSVQGTRAPLPSRWFMQPPNKDYEPT